MALIKIKTGIMKKNLIINNLRTKRERFLTFLVLQQIILISCKKS